MKKYPCPSCGAEIPFRTSIAAYAVCPYCRTMVVRDDDGLRKIGDMAQLPEDMSPFQIGTEGTYRGVRFGVVGRMKMAWDSGTWNEWFIVSDDARRGWLAEAQGFYAPCFEVDPADPANERAIGKFRDWSNAKLESEMWTKNPAGQRVQLGGRKYKVVDVKQAECVASEGELPFSAPKGRKSLSIDMIADEGEFASVDIADGVARLFTGNYVEWQDLACRYYRSFEGW